MRLIAAAFALALSGCSGDDRSPAAEAPAANESAAAPAASASPPGSEPRRHPLPPVAINPYRGQAGLDDLTWSYFVSGGGSGVPVLIYGYRGSDGTAINLQCLERGEVTALVQRPDDERSREPIILASYPVTTSLEPRLDKPDTDNQVTARAELPLDAPVLSAFRRTGLLTVTGGGEIRQVDAIDGAEKARVARFFDACSR